MKAFDKFVRRKIVYPCLSIDKEKLTKNAKFLIETCEKKQVDVMAVTKAFCAIPEVAEIFVKAGARYLADSRVENLKKLSDLSANKVLLRLPMADEIEDVVSYANISLNSERSTIKALGDEAKKRNCTHGILLMIDLGDLREGILPSDVSSMVKFILDTSGVTLKGVGVNLTCYGGVIPDQNNLGKLVDLARQIEEEFDVKLDIVSGGNSSSYYLVENGNLPKGITNLRLGELLLLGRETAYGNPVKNTCDDAFCLKAQIVELKEKASMPTGTIGMDAFGNVPVFEDEGIMKRAILAVGRQDVSPDDLIPHDKNIEILGASSDHLILNVTKSEETYKVGDTLSFGLTYGSLLSLSTSSYVSKEVL